MWGKRGRVVKEHVQRTCGQNQRGWDPGWEDGMAGVEGSGGGERETAVFDHQLKI